MAPIARPLRSRSAEAFSVVAMTSPEALRGFSRALRVTPSLDDHQGGSELAPRALMKGQRLPDHPSRRKPSRRASVIGPEDLTLRSERTGSGRS